MSDDRAIWETAAYLVAKHGDAAPSIAKEQAARLAERDDDASSDVWFRVMKAASELVRNPRAAAEVH
jgi:hypothetical protein